MLTCLTLALATLLTPAMDAQQAVGKSRYILATGRRLPYVYAVSLDAALVPANDRTANAIVGRGKVAAEGLDGRFCGTGALAIVRKSAGWIGGQHDLADRRRPGEHRRRPR